MNAKSSRLAISGIRSLCRKREDPNMRLEDFQPSKRLS
jgi:hypothetical protein